MKNAQASRRGGAGRIRQNFSEMREAGGVGWHLDASAGERGLFI
jgi:hypothetical protein